MRVVCTADFHGMFDGPPIPEGDLLIVAGDITNLNEMENLDYIRVWLQRQPHKYKIVIAGNHDKEFVKNRRRAEAHLKGWNRIELIGQPDACIYLQDSMVEIEGLKVYGTPWTIETEAGMAFGLHGEALQEKWNKIPMCDILVTHSPCMGILDMNQEGRHIGAGGLREALLRIQPKLHVFGHAHESYGTEILRYTDSAHGVAVNAALTAAVGDYLRPAFVINI